MNESTETLLVDDGYCFVCGKDNPIGLHLQFAWEGDVYVTRYVPGKAHQGWENHVHGGFLALVIDETTSRAVLDRHGWDWVTAELTTRMVSPARVGESLIVRSWIVQVRGKLILAAGDVAVESTGRVVATGQAKMMRAKRRA